MTANELTTYSWENNDTTLVFEFTISPGNPPTQMSLVLYAITDPGNKFSFQSADEAIVFKDLLIGGFLLNGRLWMNNSASDHGYVEADLDYGTSPDEQDLEGALVKYYYTKS